MYCAACGHKIEETAKFCTFCGEKQKQKEEPVVKKCICKRCNKEFDPEMLFCDQCGMRVQLVSQQQFANEKDQAFMMRVSHIFKISGQGKILHGEVLKGTIQTGEMIEVCGNSYRVQGISYGKNNIAKGLVGMEIGLLIDSLAKDISPGSLVLKKNR